MSHQAVDGSPSAINSPLGRIPTLVFAPAGKRGSIWGVQGGVQAVQPTESELEAKARSGDAAAFGALIRAWDRDLRGVAWSVVRSPHATDDVMQAAYEKAFRSLDHFDGRSALRTWLHSIVYRTALDHVRYEGRRRHADLEVVDRVRSGPDSASGPALTQVELSQAMDALDPGQRAALMLTAGLGYSFDEAAAITGEPRGTIASRVGRARKKLARWEGS
jgi:RNA polymerase sigma-70 factor (ECF subfamily)